MTTTASGKNRRLATGLRLLLASAPGQVAGIMAAYATRCLGPAGPRGPGWTGARMDGVVPGHAGVRATLTPVSDRSFLPRHGRADQPGLELQAPDTRACVPARRARWVRPACVLGMCVAGSAALPPAARAQLLNRYIPDYAPGLTETPEEVHARVEPEFRSDGVRVGSFVIRPRVDESFGYDSNADGLTGGRGSPAIDTQASLAAGSDWSRNSVAAVLSVNDERYTARPVQDFTNWTAMLSGTYDIGRDRFAGSYTHLNVAETPRDLGAVTAVPVLFQVDDFNLSYDIAGHGRVSFVPSLDVASYRFDGGNIVGVPGLAAGGYGLGYSQNWQNRVVTQGELTTRYELSPGRNVLVVLRGTEISYASHPAIAGDRDSAGGAALVGLDYAGSGVFRYRALVGYEVRDHASAQYANISSPIVEASVIWTPRLLTTVTGTARREIDDSTDLSSISYTANSVQLNVAQQVRRNVVLTGFGEYQQAAFSGSVASAAQGGVLSARPQAQSIYAAGLGATWLLNRTTRLNLSYQFLDRRSGPPLSFTENVALLTLGFGL